MVAFAISFCFVHIPDLFLNNWLFSDDKEELLKKKSAMANITKKTSTKRKSRKGDGKGKSVGAENGERQDAEREKKQDEKQKERAEKQKKKEQKERERKEKEKEREALAQRDKLYQEKLQQIADGTFWGGENADRAGG